MGDYTDVNKFDVGEVYAEAEAKVKDALVTDETGFIARCISSSCTCHRGLSTSPNSNQYNSLCTRPSYSQRFILRHPYMKNSHKNNYEVSHHNLDNI